MAKVDFALALTAAAPTRLPALWYKDTVEREGRLLVVVVLLLGALSLGTVLLVSRYVARPSTAAGPELQAATRGPTGQPSAEVMAALPQPTATRTGPAPQSAPSIQRAVAPATPRASILVLPTSRPSPSTARASSIPTLAPLPSPSPHPSLTPTVLVVRIAVFPQSTQGSWVEAIVDGIPTVATVARAGQRFQWMPLHRISLNIGDTSAVLLIINGQICPHFTSVIHGQPRRVAITGSACP